MGARPSLDLSREENRRAFYREYVRRYGLPGKPQVPQPGDEQASRRAGYHKDGTPNRQHPVTAAVDVAFSQMMALPYGPTRQKAEVDVFRMAVAARHYDAWTRLLAPGFVSDDFSEAHRAMWAWWLRIERNKPIPPMAAAIFRGGAKSATAVLMTAGCALSHLRDYGLYVHAVRDKAQDEVAAVSSLLQSDLVERSFPSVAAIYETKSGSQRGDRLQRFRNQAGFTLDALGMDQALRGKRIDEDRPGWIILDDLEDHRDSVKLTAKKLSTLTASLIPAGSQDVAICFAQNLIHPNSIMSGIAARTGEVMSSRVMVGPFPAVKGLTYRERSEAEQDRTEEETGERRMWEVTGGEPTWARYGLADAERELNLMGPASFEREKQHNFDVVEGDMFPSDRWQYCEPSEVPKLVAVARAWDLAASESLTADWSVGTIGGITARGDVYVLDQFRDQLEIAHVEDRVTQLADTDAERYPKAKTLIEKQTGTAQKHYAIRWETIMGTRSWDYSEPTANKVARAGTAAGKVQRQRVWLVRGAWNARLVREAALFPEMAPNDDQVDSLAHLVNWLAAQLAAMQHRKSTVREAAGSQITRADRAARGR